MTCGGGVRHRTRECNNPKTVLPGKTCEEQGLGPTDEMETCNVQSCPGKVEMCNSLPSLLVTFASLAFSFD